jgi:hypothetical protein
MYFNRVWSVQCMYIVCTSDVQDSYSVYTEHFQKRVCTYKLHHFWNSLSAVCTEYILCASVYSTESVPAAYSKSLAIKAFIQIITLSGLHPFPIAGGRPEDREAARPRRPRRPRRPPPQCCRAGRVGLRCCARPCCRTEGA